MTRYRCPKCGETIDVLSAREVGHRCPSNRSRFTRFEETK